MSLHYWNTKTELTAPVAMISLKDDLSYSTSSMSSISLSSSSSSEDEHLQFQAIYTSSIINLCCKVVEFSVIYLMTQSERQFQKENLQLFANLLYSHLSFPDDCSTKDHSTKDRVIVANRYVVPYETGLIIVLC
jgi:hypothetical protein